MRRDDIVVADDSCDCDEISFINRYWTKIWMSNLLGPELVREVIRRDEYRLLAPYLSYLAKGSRILDGGCGRGEWTVFLNARGYETHGVDVSSAVIERLSHMYPDVSFRVGDIRLLEYPDAYFDALISWGTFEHFEDGLQACFDEAWRVLKPGGMLSITVPFYNLRHRLEDRIFNRKAVDAPNRRFYQWRLMRKELAAEFSNGGFELDMIQPIHKQEGVARLLDRFLLIRTGTTLSSMLKQLISFFIPAFLVAHMLFGIGFKVVSPGSEALRKH